MLDYLRQSGASISNGEYLELFLVSKRTASNDLRELATIGLLTIEGAVPATRYRLTYPDASLPDSQQAHHAILRLGSSW